jgi:hypothetical protein
LIKDKSYWNKQGITGGISEKGFEMNTVARFMLGNGG